ncbi:hypothetical protein ACFE04_022168 [Oxalis oulophora]
MSKQYLANVAVASQDWPDGGYQLCWLGLVSAQAHRQELIQNMAGSGLCTVEWSTDVSRGVGQVMILAQAAGFRQACYLFGFQGSLCSSSASDLFHDLDHHATCEMQTLLRHMYLCYCAVLHYEHAAAPNDRTLNDGDKTLFDIGAEYPFYGSDITCSFPVSIMLQRKLLRQLAVLRAHDTIIAAMKPGINWPLREDKAGASSR